MKEIEITVRVLDDKATVVRKLEAAGFKKIRSFTMVDNYLCADLKGLSKNNIAEYLRKCILLRQINMENGIIQKLTYKNKTFKNGTTLSEEKINVEIDNINNARALFTALNFQELISIKNTSEIYQKGSFELAIQDIDGLGLLIEYENENDFTEQDESVILQTKIEMLQAIKALGICTTAEFDVKKAYELVTRKLAAV